MYTFISFHCMHFLKQLPRSMGQENASHSALDVRVEHTHVEMMALHPELLLLGQDPCHRFPRLPCGLTGPGSLPVRGGQAVHTTPGRADRLTLMKP